MKKITITKDNRTFECYPAPEGCGIVGVNVREIKHPNRKFFRTKHFGYSWVFLDDNNSIEECCEACLRVLLLNEKRDNERLKKWKEFEKTS